MVYVLTNEDYKKIKEDSKNVSLFSKVGAFFKHVYYMSVAPRTPERDHYRTTFKQFERLDSLQ